MTVVLGLSGGLASQPGWSEDGVGRILENAAVSRSGREAVKGTNIQVLQFEASTEAALRKVVGTCCGNTNGTTGLGVEDFKCQRPGKGAAACVQDLRSDNGLRDAQMAYRKFLARTPPEMVSYITQSCGGTITPKCLQDSLKRTEGDFMNDEGFYDLAIQMNAKYGDSFDPWDVTSAASNWLGAEAALGVLEVACERVQGNFNAKTKKYLAVDAGCHTRPDYSVVPTTYAGPGKSGSGNPSLSEVETGAQHWFTNDATRNKSHAVDLGAFSIPDPTGLLENSCPGYINKNNSLKLAGKYAPACDPATGSVSLSTAYEKYVDQNVRDLLLREMAAEEMRVTASNLGLVTSTVPGVGSMDSFVAEVQKACSGDSSDMVEAFNSGLAEGKAEGAKATVQGDGLWKDVAAVVALVDTNQRAIAQIDGTLKEKCGFFEYQIGGAFATDPMKAACFELIDHRKRLEDFQEDSFRNYPFLAQKIDGSDDPIWSQMASSMKLSDARRIALGKEGKVPTDAESAQVRGLYLKALAERKAKTLARVKEVCADPNKEGLNNLNNPLIVGSFFDRDPGNKSAGWALCKAYADEHLSETKVNLAWTAANVGSLFIPGIGLFGQITTKAMAWGTVAMAGASVLKTADDLSALRDEAIRNEAQYLAGAGNVADYLRAKASQDSFMSEVLQGGGLETLNLAATALQVIPTVRGGAALLRFAEDAGQLGRTLDAAREMRGYERAYQKGAEIAVRLGDGWSAVRVDEVLEGGRKLKVTDAKGVSHIIDGTAQVAHEARYVEAAHEAERTSEIARAQLSGKATASGREVYIPRSSGEGMQAVTEARVGKPVYVTLEDGTRVRGTLKAAVREGEEVTALKVELPGGKVAQVSDLAAVRVGQDTFVAPELVAQYRMTHAKWYDAFGKGNEELLDKIIDIYTGRELMKDPAAMAEITRLLGGGAVDLSKGLSAQVMAKLGDRAAQLLAKARAKVEEQVRRLGGGCGVKG